MNILCDLNARNFLHGFGSEQWRGIVHGELFLLIMKMLNACKIQVIS